ncbi:MAG: MoaD/ThiS family protein [Conexivisphaerales archaeon]
MAIVEVFIPSVISNSKEKARIKVDAKDVKELLFLLDKDGIVERNRLFDDSGKIKKFLNLYVNGKRQNDLEIQLNDGDEVSILPSVAGG